MWSVDVSFCSGLMHAHWNKADCYLLFCFVLRERMMTSLPALPPVFGVAFDVEA